MQFRKKDVREKIIIAAKEEFQDNSFQQSSIRTIAKKAGVTPSNIYNYFKNKDEIFRTILQPLINDIENGKKEFVKFEVENQEHENLESHKFMARQVALFINENREVLNLLVFKSKGSSYENYVDELIDWFTEGMKKSFYQHAKDHVDDFLIHITASIWVNSIREVLMHDISGERTIRIAEDTMAFIFLGWQGMMKKYGIH